MVRKEAIVFTLNNYTEDEEKSLSTLVGREFQIGRTLVSVKYVLYGREVGAEGTPHLQGYLRFDRDVSVEQVIRCRERIGLRNAFLEGARGSFVKNFKYCTKDGSYLEFGERPASGSRTDLNEIRDLIVHGASETVIANDHFSQWVQYRRSFREFTMLSRERPRSWKTSVSVFVGPTGTGKTRRAVAEASDHGDGVYWMSWDNSLRWFDGYSLEKCVILDDFTGHGCDFAFLLRLLDRYRFRVPIKGGTINWQPTWIWITSNLQPREWFTGAAVTQQQIDALMRRIDEVILIE